MPLHFVKFYKELFTISCSIYWLRQFSPSKRPFFSGGNACSISRHLCLWRDVTSGYLFSQNHDLKPASTLSFSKLGCNRGGRQLFQNVDCVLEAGRWLYVAGANGVGKTCATWVT